MLVLGLDWKELYLTRLVFGTYNVAVDEELNEEQVAETLGLAREGTEDTSWAAVEYSAETSCGRFGGKGGDLLVVLAHEHQTGDEGSENLGENIVGDLLPWEALPCGQADCDGWVEVTVMSRSDMHTIISELGARLTLRMSRHK